MPQFIECFGDTLRVIIKEDPLCLEKWWKGKLATYIEFLVREILGNILETHTFTVCFLVWFFPCPSTLNNVCQVICESGTYYVSVVESTGSHYQQQAHPGCSIIECISGLLSEGNIETGLDLGKSPLDINYFRFSSLPSCVNETIYKLWWD